MRNVNCKFECDGKCTNANPKSEATVEIKANDFQRYIRARKLALYNRGRGFSGFVKQNEALCTTLESTYPDFKETYNRVFGDAQ